MSNRVRFSPQTRDAECLEPERLYTCLGISRAERMATIHKHALSIRDECIRIMGVLEVLSRPRVANPMAVRLPIANRANDSVDRVGATLVKISRTLMFNAARNYENAPDRQRSHCVL